MGPEFRIFSKIFRKTQYLMNTLYFWDVWDLNKGVINQYITFHSYISRYSRGDISFDNMYFLKNAYRTINGNFAKIKRKRERIYT